MAEDVLEIGPAGVRVELRRTGEETGGELLEFDVVGRVRGFLAEPHVHARQTERLEVIEGSLELQVNGRTHLLRPGESMEVPPGVAHRQRTGDGGEGRIRIQVRPAGSTRQFLERVAEMAATGGLTKRGYPRPVAGAKMVRDFGDEGHAARPSLRTQKAIARAILAVASNEYLFVDEWDVAAAPAAVFDALADGRTYPEWWKPVYIAVEADGPPAPGKESRQHFKGRLPYHLRTRSRIVRHEPPRLLEVEVDGDLRGNGVWTLTPTAGGATHVRFDWRVHADRRRLRVLTPLLRPVFRWNHNWAIARAMEGLEPYARAV
ncbi:MAG TPA: SRPBCC family protein [Solirubrobacteraceae bacterium]